VTISGTTRGRRQPTVPFVTEMTPVESVPALPWISAESFHGPSAPAAGVTNVQTFSRCRLPVKP